MRVARGGRFSSGASFSTSRCTPSFAKKCLRPRRRRRMPIAMAVQVTIYLNESDKWQGKPLHMSILNYLHDENVFAACTLHAVGGFLGRQRVKTSHLVDAGGKLPIIIIFVDTDEHVSRVLPKLKEMAAHRLIVRENVVLEQGNLD